MEDKIVKCTHLWQKWEKNDLDLVQVNEAKKRMRSYSKNDWENMITHATEVMEGISLLIKENIDIKDPRSEKAFQKYLDHVSEYFFKADEQYVSQLYFAIRFDKQHQIFFEQFHEGTTTKMLRLIEAYPEKYRS
jgi:hypothetical protein